MVVGGLSMTEARSCTWCTIYFAEREVVGYAGSGGSSTARQIIISIINNHNQHQQQQEDQKQVAQTLKQVLRQAAPPLPRHHRELRQDPLEVRLRCFRQELVGRRGDEKGMILYRPGQVRRRARAGMDLSTPQHREEIQTLRGGSPSPDRLTAVTEM